MNRTEKKLFEFINLTIFIQGLLYYFFKYFMQEQTQFGERPHALTSVLLHLHIILVPFLVFFFGIMFKSHVINKLKDQKRKRSGYTILAMMLLMIFSGYFLQTGLDLELNRWIGYIHIFVSVVWFFCFLWHSNIKLRSVSYK